METRRNIMAIGLSMFVLIVYMQFFAPQPPIEQPPHQPEAAAPAPTAKPEPAPTTSRPKTAAAAKSIAVATAGKDIVIETDVVKAVVSTAGGVITKWELKNYREADKEEVGFMVTMKKLFSGEKKAEAPKKPLGNVELFTRYDGLKPEDLVAPLTVTPPNFVELEIVQTGPGLRGDTATGGTKPAKLATGATVRVPLFLDIGGPRCFSGSATWPFSFFSETRPTSR